MDLQYTAALDKLTGQTVWKTNRSVAFHDEDVQNERAKLGDLRKGHSTPIIVNSGGRPVLLSAGAKAFYAYDPLTGSELWMAHHADYSPAPRPLYENGIGYFISGMSKTELYAIKVAGAGDVTSSNVVWRLNTHIGKFSSPILVDHLIYTAAADNFLNCLDAGTGAVVWTERIGGSYEASPIFAGDRIYFFNQEGGATVIKPGRTCNIIATNTLDDGMMASPAVAGNALYLRTKSHLYRIEQGARP